MNLLKFKYLAIAISFIFLNTQCLDDQICPKGLRGINCDKMDTTQIQNLLKEGETPLTLLNLGFSIENFYGKEYAGGLIFHLNEDGTGMVAAPEDQGRAEWGCFQIENSGADGEILGTGAQNTLDIIMSCDEPEIAAKICDQLSLNGNEDWFLPSIDELALMYENLHEKRFGDFTGIYWSSTEFDAESAWRIYFWDGNPFNFAKTDDYRVRAVSNF